MNRDDLIPKDSPPDMRAIHRFALAEATAARRRGRVRAARDWDGLVRKALRALRFSARIEAGRAHGYPHSSHPPFSDAPKKVPDTVAPAAPLDPDRHRTFREGRRRR